MRRDLGALLLTLGLVAAGCEQPDYSGASFKPVEGPERKAVLVLYLFEPHARDVPWGDAAFFHRASPAALGAEPVRYRARLGVSPWVESDEEGGVVFQEVEGSYGLRVEVGERAILRRVDLEEGQLEVALWSLDEGRRALGLRRRYPTTEILAGPVAEVSKRFPDLRDLRTALRDAFQTGDEAQLERLLAEDFRDPLGGRRDFLRAVRHRQQNDRPWSLVGDTWVDLQGKTPRMWVVLEGEGRRTFPTLELEESARGVGGYRVRSMY